MSTVVLTLTRGLPASGKTTWAKDQTAAVPCTVRVNRDDIRAMLLPVWPHGDPVWEWRCTVAQHAQIRALLETGTNVICDDTNLTDDAVWSLLYLARCAGAQVHVKDFTDVPVQVCIERDAARPDPVGAAVIERMWADYQAAKELVLR
jgi:predicted kinase